MRRSGLAALLVATVISVACSSKSDGHLSQAHDPAPPTGTLGPPTFTLFANKELSPQFMRFLERKIREHFGFGAAPLKMRVRKRGG